MDSDAVSKAAESISGGRRAMKAAVYTGTRNLYGLMVPAVKSLICNSDVDEVWLLIEDDVFPHELPDVVNVRNVSGQTYFRADGPNMGSRFTYMAMMRAALAKEFPDYDRILALDVDTIVDGDISELWGLPLERGYYLAAAHEPVKTNLHGRLCVNIGVCLYNLAKLRDGMCDTAIGRLNSEPYRYLEQDVFNELCAGKILNISANYNATRFTARADNPKIVHFAGESEWGNKPLVKKYMRMSWNEALSFRGEHEKV